MSWQTRNTIEFATNQTHQGFVRAFLAIGGVMNKKLGQVMTSSRMVTFIAFLTAIFAWFLSMHALFTFTVLALICAAYIYIKDKVVGYTHAHALVRAHTGKVSIYIDE
ncbi:hypothetical protein JCM19238_151 [Vibrio ponticus]|nr:hypothetical protein JCM19238_151 [Vibrio ponticus]